MQKEGLDFQDSVGLKENEKGFADSGFKALKNINSIPWKTCPLTPAVAHYRIVIEQMFEKIKNWTACRKTIRLKIESNEDNLHRFHQECWTIVSVFVNRYCIHK